MADKLSPFEEALEMLLEIEGGFVDDPEDCGGATCMGVTQRVYDAYRKTCGLEFRSVSEIDEAEACQIYLDEYWRPARCHELSSISVPVAQEVFEVSVHCGVHLGGALLQQACNCLRLPDSGLLTVDGVCGPITRSAVARLCVDHELALFTAQNGEQYKFYCLLQERNPKDSKFMRGWMKRVAFRGGDRNA